MQPLEPGNASGTPVGEGVGGGRPRNRRLRLWVAVVAGVLGLLCLGGVGVGVLLYDKETKIDRGSPDVATDSFLIAYLVDRNDKEAPLFLCDSPKLDDLGRLRDELVSREREFGVTVSVSWGSLTRAAVGDGRENVSTQLTISGSSAGKTTSSRTEEWQFQTVDQDGWRVCGAVKVG